MRASDLQTALIPHPSTPSNGLQITAKVALAESGVLRLDYIVTGDIDDIQVPLPAVPSRTDGLWQSTCFETFIGLSGGCYVELNFAPSGQWAAYHFDGYRSGMRALEGVSPEIKTKRTARETFELTATLDIATLIADMTGALGLSVVIEEVEGTKSYWAIAHPESVPDFHHADCFAMRLPAFGDA